MEKYVIDGETLSGLANALRSVTGETRSYTPTEMIDAVTNIMETGTYILVDEAGNEIPAVFVENEMRFNATANDIRIGTIAVTDSGVTEGTKEIPGYVTEEGYRKILSGDALVIPMYSNMCEFTKLQAIICKFNTTPDDSVAAEKVSIAGKVYPVSATNSLSDVKVDNQNRTIDFSLMNNSDHPVIVRYFTYKEVY